MCEVKGGGKGEVNELGGEETSVVACLLTDCEEQQMLAVRVRTSDEMRLDGKETRCIHEELTVLGHVYVLRGSFIENEFNTLFNTHLKTTSSTN